MQHPAARCPPRRRPARGAVGHFSRAPRVRRCRVGSNGAGRPLAQRLLADGEHVVDVPAKLSARARLFDTGYNRKNDARDAPATRRRSRSSRSVPAVFGAVL